MPSSNPHQITTIVNWIVRLAPKSVLDIGVGFGKYGLLAREYLDISHGRLLKSEWKVRIDGIEIAGMYVSPHQTYLYNRLQVGDVLTLLPSTGDYDLILLCDAIEHLKKSSGRWLLRECLRKATYVIVSSPLAFYEQHYLGLESEKHRSVWYRSDFESAVRYVEFSGRTFAVLLRGARDSRFPRRIRSSAWDVSRARVLAMLQRILDRLQVDR